MTRPAARLSGPIALALLAFVAGCGPDEATRPAAARAQMRADPGLAAAWPLLLLHCLRTPSCDPMAQIGDGAGEASGVAGEVVWRALSTGDRGDGAGDITISLVAVRGRGGDAGRPLGSAELPATLRARRDRSAWLSLTYSSDAATGAARDRPTSMLLRSPHLALAIPGAPAAASRRALGDTTRAHVQTMVWPDGARGARIEVSGASGVLLAATTEGAPAGSTLTDADALRLGGEPWVFELASTQPPDALVAALGSGETLSLRISTPDGGAVLTDAFYAGGFAAALEAAAAALKDPAIAQPIAVRCAPLSAEPDAFWRAADVSPALRVCDPRTPEQRAADARPPPL